MTNDPLGELVEAARKAVQSWHDDYPQQIIDKDMMKLRRAARDTDWAAYRLVEKEELQVWRVTAYDARWTHITPEINARLEAMVSQIEERLQPFREEEDE